MKKLLLITLICILAVGLFADGAARIYSQKISNQTTADGQLPGVINGATSTAPNYHLSAWIVSRPGEVLSTNPLLDTDTENGANASPPAIIRIWRLGNGTTSPYTSVATVALAEFETPWVAGDILHLQVDYLGDLTGYAPIASSFWEMTIPTGTTAITWTTDATSLIPIPSVPPFPGAVVDYDITVNSTPAGAAIYLDGAATGFVTPHVWENLAAGWDGLFSVMLPNYTWMPVNYQVTDLAANLTIDFVGTFVPPITPPLAPNYVAPPNGAQDLDYAGQTLVWASGDRNGGMRSRQADRNPATGYMVYFGTNNPPTNLLNGIDVGNVFSYMTGPLVPNTTYYWQIVAYNTAGNTPGAVWSFETMETPIPYYNVNVTSTPAGADIWINGVDTGFNTPHLFSYPEHSALDVYVVLPHYTFLPLNYMIADLTAPAVLNFMGTYVPWIMYDVQVTSAPAGAAIWVNGLDTGLLTPYTFSWIEGTNATIAVVKEHYTYAPASYTLTNLAANMSYNFVGTYIPWIMYDVAITSVPTGQPILFNGSPTGQTTPWTFQLLEGTGGTYSIGNTLYTWAPPTFVVTNIQMNLSQNFVGTLIPTTYTVYVSSDLPGAEIFVDGVSTGLFTGATPVPIVLALPGPHVITLGPVVIDNITYYFPNPIPATTNGQMIDFGGGTVPVVLSSFTATVTSDLFVSLVWVVQSETQVLGYNIYRAGTSDVTASSRVNGQVINANNLSTQQTYSFVDDTEGLAVNNTYYYWLENVDMTGIVNMYGPRMVTITGTVTPPLPTSSVLNNAYPNPFRMGGTANIGVKVAEGETGTLTIFNLLGQKIVEKTYGAGEFNYEWNAKGNASGIYFYKLSTPSTNVTKKLVIVN